MKPHLINVDFEFTSQHDLSDLVCELKDKVDILTSEIIDNEYHLRFELRTLKEPIDGSAEIINSFLNLIDELPDQSKRTIYNCNKKVIDLGFNSGHEGWLYSSISSQVLKKISDTGFQLNISIYGI